MGAGEKVVVGAFCCATSAIKGWPSDNVVGEGGLGDFVEELVV